MIDKISAILRAREVDADGRSTRAELGGMTSTLNELTNDELPIVLQALTAAGASSQGGGFDYTFDFDLE